MTTRQTASLLRIGAAGVAVHIVDEIFFAHDLTWHGALLAAITFAVAAAGARVPRRVLGPLALGLGVAWIVGATASHLAPWVTEGETAGAYTALVEIAGGIAFVVLAVALQRQARVGTA